ncbi:MAG: hypothetical protein ACI4HI_05850 [Lachnospiraceae bacterium]
MDDVEKQIREFIQKIRRRLRLQCLIHYVGISMIVGVGVCLFLSLVSCLIPFYAVYQIEIGVLLISVLIGLFWGIRKTPTREKAALLADSRGYQEKFSTAFALVGEDNVFAGLQKADACRQMETFSVKEQFPISVSKKWVCLFTFLTLLCLASQFLETPARQTASEQYALVKEKKAEDSHLKKVEKKLEKQTGLSKKECAAVKEMFETARKQFKEAKTKQQLQQAQARLQKKLQSAGEQTKKKDLAKMLEKEARRAGEKAGQSGQEQQIANQQQKQGQTGSSENTDASKNASAWQGQNGSSGQASGESSSGASSGKESETNNTEGKNGGNNNEQGSSGTGNTGSGANGQGDAGQGTGETGQGNESGHGQGWNRGGKEGKEGKLQEGEPITIPKGKVGDDKNLTGKANGNETDSQREKSEQTNGWEGDRVEYGKVSAQYKQKALQQTERAQYPAEMKEKIKQYFSGLN